MMRYLSVCSGIEAASVAWHPLGWRPVGFAEIEKFPAAVLAHHFPDVPNLGDMTKFEEWPDEPVDLLVGGTPCQSFSIAGLRAGLSDPRGNLMLTYGAIAAKRRPRWLVWENVPGVLSSNRGRDFASFLSLLGQRGYGWAYRVLDAQYIRVDGFPHAVPQRRRRVFVVGYLGDWRRAAAVLFDRASLSGDHPPRRETGQKPAPTISARPTGGGGLGTDFDLDGGLIVSEVAPTLNAHFGDKQGLENQHINGGCGLFVAHALRGEGFDASEDGTGRGTPLVPVAHPYVLMERGRGDGPNLEYRADGTANAILTPNGGRGGLGVGTVAFPCKDYGNDAIEECSPTLRAIGGALPNGGGQLAVAFAIQERAVSENLKNGPQGLGVQADHTYTLEARNNVQAVATPWAVRRLTPTECERLQGFPDGWSDIPWRGKPGAPDGPRYKALGNSMAVNVMRWIGRRIEMVDAMTQRDDAK